MKYMFSLESGTSLGPRPRRLRSLFRPFFRLLLFPGSDFLTLVAGFFLWRASGRTNGRGELAWRFSFLESSLCFWAEAARCCSPRLSELRLGGGDVVASGRFGCAQARPRPRLSDGVDRAWRLHGGRQSKIAAHGRCRHNVGRPPELLCPRYDGCGAQTADEYLVKVNLLRR